VNISHIQGLFLRYNSLTSVTASNNNTAKIQMLVKMRSNHMAMQVCNGATLMCSCGVAPSSLVVLPINRVLTSNQPAANIMDHKPMLNILPFGMCTTPTNPVVATATTAAAGVLTPMPCVPMTMTPWIMGAPTVLLGYQPALNNTSKLMCSWGGSISIVVPGQFTHIIP
jgi:hypothetical protein